MFGEATPDVSGTFAGEAIRLLSQIVAPQIPLFFCAHRFRRRWRDLRVRLTRNAIFRNRYGLGVSIANKSLRYFEFRMYVIIFEIFEADLVPKTGTKLSAY